MPKSISVEKNSAITFLLSPNDNKWQQRRQWEFKLFCPFSFPSSLPNLHDMPFPTNTVYITIQTLNSISASKNSAIVYPIPIDIINKFMEEKEKKRKENNNSTLFILFHPPSLKSKIRLQHAYPNNCSYNTYSISVKKNSKIVFLWWLTYKRT